MKYGLSEAIREELDRLVIQPLKDSGALVFIFGSRSRGDQKPFSDVDLLVESEKDISALLARASEAIENSNFPFKVDIVELKDIADSYRASALRDRILL